MHPCVAARSHRRPLVAAAGPSGRPPTSQRGLVTPFESVVACSPPRRMALKLKSPSCSGVVDGWAVGAGWAVQVTSGAGVPALLQYTNPTASLPLA